MRRLCKIVSGVAAIPLLLAILLGSTMLVALTPQVYFHEYNSLHQEIAIGCDRPVLDNITVALIDYMKGDREDLHMQAIIGGEMKEVFSDRDKAHMVDVKYLFDLARYFFLIALAASAVLLLSMTLLSPKKHPGAYVGDGFLWGAGAFVLIIAVLAINIVLNFETAFITFHKIFFNNDLWLLPSDSVLLTMMPTPFFTHLASYIGILFAWFSGITIIFAVIWRKGSRRAIAREADLPDGVKTTPPAHEPITAVTAEDGDRFVLSQQDQSRPEAQDIFDQFGLTDADDQPLLPQQTVAETVQPIEEQENVQETPLQEVITKTEDVSPQTDDVSLQTDDVSPQMDDGMTLRIPIQLPSYAVVNGRMIDGMKLEITFSLAEDASSQEPGRHKQTVAPSEKETAPMDAPIPDMDTLLERMDEIMAGLPQGEK